MTLQEAFRRKIELAIAKDNTNSIESSLSKKEVQMLSYSRLTIRRLIEYFRYDYRRIPVLGQYLFIPTEIFNIVLRVANLDGIKPGDQRTLYALLVLKIINTNGIIDDDRFDFNYKAILKYGGHGKDDETIRNSIKRLMNLGLLKTSFWRNKPADGVIITKHYAQIYFDNIDAFGKQDDNFNLMGITDLIKDKGIKTLIRNLELEYKTHRLLLPSPVGFTQLNQNPFMFVSKRGVCCPKEFMQFDIMFTSLNLNKRMNTRYLQKKCRDDGISKLKVRAKSIKYLKIDPFSNEHNCLFLNFANYQNEIFQKGIFLNEKELLRRSSGRLFRYIGKEGRTIKRLYTYLQRTGDNTYYPTYKVHKSVSGRSSLATPDITNISKAERDIFIARENKIFLFLDVKSAEVSFFGLYFKDEEVINLLEKGKDLYSRWAEDLGIGREEVKILSHKLTGSATFPSESHGSNIEIQKKFDDYLKEIHPRYYSGIQSAKDYMKNNGVSMKTLLGYHTLPKDFSRSYYAGAAGFSQACVSEICHAWLLEMAKLIKEKSLDYNIALFIHDEVIIELPDRNKDINYCLDLAQDAFSRVVGFFQDELPQLMLLSIGSKLSTSLNPSSDPKIDLQKILGKPEHPNSISAAKGDFFPWQAKWIM